MTDSRFEVAIIGGGIVGSFVAYFLGKAGVNVCVIERGFPATGTSGATLAWVFSSLKPPVHYAMMHKKSVEMYEELQREHQVDFGLNRSGSLWLVWDPQEWREIQEEVRQLKDGGIPVDLLEPDQVHQMEPQLDPSALIGAAYGRRDGSVNPFLANMQMARLSQQLGVTWRNYTPVVDIERYRRGFRLQTVQGCIEAERIVVAAGIWSRDIGKMLGFPIPLIPVRGQVLVSAPVKKQLFRHTIGNAFLYQHPQKGTLLLGSLQEHGEDSNVNTWDGMGRIVQTVLRVAPSLKDIPIIRAFSGIRPIPFDGLPLLGEIPGHPGIFAAITHSGFSLAPVVGLLTAEMITGRALSFDAEPYRIERVLYEQDPFAAVVKFR